MRCAITVTDPSESLDPERMHLIAGMPGVRGKAQLAHLRAQHAGPIGDGEGSEWGAVQKCQACGGAAHTLAP